MHEEGNGFEDENGDEELEAGIKEALGIIEHETAEAEPDADNFWASNEFVEKLRALSNELGSLPGADTKTILFPGWDVEDGDQSILIQDAAHAILNEGVPFDEGTRISHKAIAALLHYIADMMEE
jgi:hypothetical protein